MVEKRLRGGVPFRYDYDPDHGRCIRSSGPGKLQNVELKYESATHVVVTGNPEPREFEFDERGNLLVEQLIGGGSKAVLTYDDDGLITSFTNAAGDCVQIEYDEEGKVVSELGPGPQDVRFIYQGELLREHVQDGRARTYEWDHRGAIASIRYPDGRLVRFEVDNHGRVNGTFGPEGPLDRYRYDDAHNIVEWTNARGATLRTTYDGMGMPIHELDAVGRTVTSEYDAIGRLVRRALRDGTVVETAYDAHDNPTLLRGGGSEHKLERWGTGVLAARVWPNGQRWEMAYDRLERLREVLNPKGESMSYRYDRAGRLVEEQTFDGQSIRYAYSRRDLVRRIDFEDGTWIEYDYDDRGLLVAKRSPHGDVLVERDERGRVVLATVDEHGGPIVTKLVRNDRDQVTEVVQNGAVVKYAYDAGGRIASRTLPNGSVTAYSYDAAGDLVGIDHDGKKILFQRDVMGREVRRYVYHNGLDVRSDYTPADRLALQEITLLREGEQPVSLVRREYRYGPHARLVESVDSRLGTSSYRHDAMGLLVEVRRQSGMEHYAYDAANSMIHAGDRPMTDPWGLGRGNVLVRAGETRFDNDLRRRRVAKVEGDRRTEYVWDCKSQLREVHVPSGQRILFQYDAFRRRVQKTIVTPAEDPTQPSTVRTVVYVWDFDELAMEIDSERGTRVFVHEPGTFEPVMQVQGAQPYMFLNDGVGVPLELVDANGRLAWSAERTAWGTVTAVQGNATLTPPFAMLGHLADEETGLSYARHRYFDNDRGRWLSADPLRLDGGPNLFAFDGAPKERSDPLGLYTRAAFKAFLEKYEKKRIAATEAAEAEQSLTGTEPKFQCASGDNLGGTGRSYDTRRDGPHFGDPSRRPHDTHRPGDANLHAEEGVIRSGSSGRAVAATLPHCANCTNDVINSGNVPASTINPSWDPEPGHLSGDGGFRPEGP
jgi:RHS repeat-associated protein